MTPDPLVEANIRYAILKRRSENYDIAMQMIADKIMIAEFAPSIIAHGERKAERLKQRLAALEAKINGKVYSK